MDEIIREFTIEDYETVSDMWESSEGIGSGISDSKENIRIFLNHNKNLSLVYEIDNKICGNILCGTDGRRGFIYHLVVNEKFRRFGIGKKLVNASLSRLKTIGIKRCNIFVLYDNETGNKFWENIGFNKRNELVMFTIDI